MITLHSETSTFGGIQGKRRKHRFIRQGGMDPMPMSGVSPGEEMEEGLLPTLGKFTIQSGV